MRKYILDDVSNATKNTFPVIVWMAMGCGWLWSLCGWRGMGGHRGVTS